MKNVSSVRKLSKCMYQVTQDTSAQLFLGECRFGSAVTEQPRVERLEKTQGLIFFIRIEEQGDGCNALSLYRILNANTTASTGIDELECTLWLVDIRTSNISNYNIGHQYESALLTQRVMVTHSDWVSVKSQGLGEVSPSASGTTSWTQGSFQSTSRSRQGLASDGQFRHLDGLSEDHWRSFILQHGNVLRFSRKNCQEELNSVTGASAGKFCVPSTVFNQCMLTPGPFESTGRCLLPFWRIFGVMTLSCYSKSLQVTHYKLTSYDT